ncbi:hypothetical protein BC834DRAFT_970070 [Gloeopeniophorella convolvens]|nr:hypothetical protein BC834DRAFT_970070 [Gloeopeniophorella convolvens]
MSSNGWYSPHNPPNSHHIYPTQHTTPSTPAPDAVHDAQSLLAVYPSLTRHLGHLSVAAHAPSYAQPHYYNGRAAHGYHHHPPPYTEYASELAHLQTPYPPTNDGGYWHTARSDTLRYLGGQQPHPGANANPYPEYAPPAPYAPAQVYPAYPTPALAASVFQHTAPAAFAYPTPPPGIHSSSSSLACALDEPALPLPPAKPKQKQTFAPQDSAAFFNTFLDKSSRELERAQAVRYAPSAAPTPSVRPPAPSALPANGSAGTPHRERSFSTPRRAPSPDGVVTPQKRKAGQDALPASSSVKRLQALHCTPSTSSLVGPPTTPASSSQGSFSMQSTPSSEIELPRAPAPRPRCAPPGKVAPARPKREPDEQDDVGGFGSEEDHHQPRKTSLNMSEAGHASPVKRTGERDERVPLEKLSTLLEDIFEAEDALPADADVAALPPTSSRRSRWTRRVRSCTLAHPQACKTHRAVARPTKRLRAATASAQTPRAAAPRSIADLETATLSRVLKLLERSVRAGEDVDPFPAVATPPPRASASPTKKKNKSPSKKSAAERRSKSQTPLGDDEPPAPEPESAPEAAVAAAAAPDPDALARALDTTRDALLAADCVLLLLGAARLPKQVYSEELLAACLGATRGALERVVYPAIEGAAPVSVVADVLQALAGVLPRVGALVRGDAVAMSDALVIQAVYIAIGPFFVVEADAAGAGEAGSSKARRAEGGFGAIAMRGLRLEALALLRSIFANYEEQRSWIIEEILSSLIKLSDTKQKAGQFRLRDGRSIRTVSALLLQLVQTSAHGVRVQSKRLAKARQQALALRRQESAADTPPEPFLDEKDSEEIQLYMSGLEAATKAAKTIVLFLTQRAGKAKATKNSNEAEYRAIFDNLVSDLLVVLFWPEWPAAGLLLGIICKYMVSSLDDIKTSSQADNNAAKTMALDHLGVIAARLRSSMLKAKQHADSDGYIGLKPLDEVMSSASIKHLERLATAHQDLATHLSKRLSDDQAYDSARELTAVTWGQELAIALRQCNAALRDGDGGDEPETQPSLLPFGRKVKAALRDVWKEATADVFDVGSPEEVARIDRLAEEIGIVQDLRNSYLPILNVTLLALDAPPVFVRTKALRALGQIVTSDPTILSAANVRRGIESHLLDSSPAVRDAAVELIGKYMIDSPEVAGNYYQKIADRIADTGLGVRKRVIKLLRSFYSVTDDMKRRIDICTKLVLRMFDEDDTVKDLAVKTLEELWFPNIVSQPALQKLRGTQGADPAADDKTQLLGKVCVIMGVAANFKDRQSPLEDVLHKIMAAKEDGEASALHARYSEICEALIDGLVDASELPGFTVVNCIRTIYLFGSAHPAILSGSNASTLLPYLKNATSPEEQVTSDYLLKIFRVSVPHMPKTAAKFGNELQLALQPMILKPSTAGGVSALQETVACLCAVVQHLTHDFTRLVGLLKSCNARLQSAGQKKQMTPADVRTLSILIFIISLLVEHCNFDRLRTEHTDLSADLDVVSKGSIIEHVYTGLLGLYQKHSESGLRVRVLQCLGFLFRAQPTLMTMESSAVVMDAIFASQEEDGRARLLKIMQEFLVSEAAKHAQKEKAKAGAKGKQAPADVDMEELVGNTDGFADSGVSSAIVQRYMEPILGAALSAHAPTQSAAVDILSFTVKQGLAHPLQSFPVLVALETSPNAALSARASALHAVLHSKHASLLNARYLVSARASFDYQVRLAQGDPGAVRGVRDGAGAGGALLARWYALVREKRAPRVDFLRALVRAFDVGARAAQADVDFARYMAENFAALEYKTQEEVLLVLKSLTNVLSTAGMQCVEALSPAHLLAQLRGPGPAQTQAQAGAADVEMADAGAAPPEQAAAPAPAPRTPPWQTLDSLPLLRSSVVIALTMLLKAHLKGLYGISEEKCLKWVIGKKNALGDRPATRRVGAAGAPLGWARLPYATRALRTVEDMAAQRETFLEIWNEDGVAAEPEDDFA